MQTIVGLALAFLTPPASAPGIDLLPDPQALDEIPADEPMLRDAADILYGMTLARRGEYDRAVEFSLKSIQREKRSTMEALAIPTLVPFLATIYWFQGRLHEAASLCREFLDPVKEKGIRYLYCRQHGCRSWGRCCTNGISWKRPRNISGMGFKPMNPGGIS